MPPSNRFPILRLPLLPFELITKSLRPLDIFSLAVSSYKVREYLKKLSFKLENLHLERLDSDSYRVQKFPETKKMESLPYRLLVLAISPEKWQSAPRDRKNSILKIDGKQYMISYHLFNRNLLRIYERTEDSTVSKETLCSISKIVSETFTSVKVVEFSDVPKEAVLPVVSENILNIHNIYLSHKTSVLTSDELSSLLEHNSAKRFELNWNVEEGVKYRNGLRYPKMVLLDAHWLTIDCLLNMECAFLTAYNVSLTIQDMKTFVKKWFEGGLENLQSVELSHRSIPFSWASLLDGYEKTLLNQQDRNSKFGWRYVAVSHVWEIRRSDGKRAGVCASHKFIFKVL